MNRREFLAAGFKLGAAGLLLPVVEPIRRYWSLDRTMLPANNVVIDGTTLTTGWFDMSMPPFTRLGSTITVGDYGYTMKFGPRLTGDFFVATCVGPNEWVIHE